MLTQHYNKTLLMGWLLSFLVSNLNIVTANSYWFSGNSLTSCGQKALELLRSADEDGLDLEDYRFAVNAVEQAQRGQGSAGSASQALTSAMIKYVDDIRNGRFDPNMADRRIVMKPDPVNASAIVSKGMSSGSCQWMSEQEPPYPEYKQLKLVYRKYNRLKQQGNWPQLSTNVNIAYGDRDSEVNTIRNILGRTGDLPASRVNDGHYFDDDLKMAVKSFQRRHGLAADGLVGPVTAKELNRTPTDRIRQIQVTMERWRWMPRNPGYRHIKVNTAGFQLEAVQNGQVFVKSPIIVGADYRETPVFTATMSGIKFNPSWHVPHNLAIQDKLPLLKKDPSYIAKNDMVLYQNVGGRMQEVNASSIDWSRYSAGNFPFSIRQRPGNNNALGKIRFTIQSPFNIFLHSTPQQYLFDFPIRTFSSGCIRVKKVVDLAYFVLNNPSVWNKGRIEQEMQGTDTKVVDLQEKIPVHITYFTVWVDEDGTPYFMPDVYGQDRQVWSVMQRS